MDEAIKKVKQLAAQAMVRRDRHAAELNKLLGEKKTLGDAPELLEMIEAKQAEHDLAEAHYQEILGQLKTIKDAGEDAERAALRAPVDAALTADPFAIEPADRALENVRDHIETLSARADLEDELNPRREPVEAPKKPKLDARAQLEALKAKKKAEQEEPEEKPPKKTM